MALTNILQGWDGHNGFEIAAGMIALATVTTAAITDVRFGVIRNRLTYPALAAGIVLAFASGGVSGVLLAVAGVFVAALPMLVGFLTGGIGGGDVKLMAALGALIGFPSVLDLLVLSLTFSAIYVLIVWLCRGVVFTLLRNVRTAILSLPLGLRAGVLPSLAQDVPAFSVPFGVMAALALAWILLGGGRLAGHLLVALF